MLAQAVQGTVRSTTRPLRVAVLGGNSRAERQSWPKGYDVRWFGSDHDEGQGPFRQFKKSATHFDHVVLMSRFVGHHFQGFLRRNRIGFRLYDGSVAQLPEALPSMFPVSTDFVANVKPDYDPDAVNRLIEAEEASQKMAKPDEPSDMVGLEDVFRKHQNPEDQMSKHNPANSMTYSPEETESLRTAANLANGDLEMFMSLTSSPLIPDGRTRSLSGLLWKLRAMYINQEIPDAEHNTINAINNYLKPKKSDKNASIGAKPCKKSEIPARIKLFYKCAQAVIALEQILSNGSLHRKTVVERLSPEFDETCVGTASRHLKVRREQEKTWQGGSIWSLPPPRDYIGALAKAKADLAKYSAMYDLGDMERTAYAPAENIATEVSASPSNNGGDSVETEETVTNATHHETSTTPDSMEHPTFFTKPETMKPYIIISLEGVGSKWADTADEALAIFKDFGGEGRCKIFKALEVKTEYVPVTRIVE